MKTITIPTAIFVSLFFGLFAFAMATPAEAACSYQGYISSGGKCSSSFKNPSNNFRFYHEEKDEDDYEHRYSYRYEDARRQALEDYIERLLDLLQRLQAQVGDSNDTDIEVTTRSAINIDEDSATLRGVLDFNGEDTADVYFEYGRTRSNLVNDINSIELDEDDDDEAFSQRVSNLREDTLYYFRAVAEDESGDKDYGSILSFRTDDSRTAEPDVTTDDVFNITDDSARLTGEVDMNDFSNGIVFFVYGEDESQVEDVADDYEEYTDIDEDGDRLQKELVDSDLDGFDDYSEMVDNLDNDTRIYFSLCVEFEDEDDDRTIVCGDTESFTTDS